MNNLRNRLSGVNGKNKRVKEKEQKIWSEIGMIAGAFALLDVIIRGIMFAFPLKNGLQALCFCSSLSYITASGLRHPECSCRE